MENRSGPVTSEQPSRQAYPVEKGLFLVEQMSAVGKNSANFSCGGIICFLFGLRETFPRAKVNDCGPPFYRKLSVPFPSVGAGNDLSRFEGHDEFVSVHFGIKVGADQRAKDFVRSRPEDWDSVYRSIPLHKILYRSSSTREVVSNH
jgi:hypothetical protein